MKYRLLKDLPTIKAGAIFQETVREVDGSKILKEYDSNNKITILVNEIKNFEEWFEEIKSTDSIYWKPKKGEVYWSRYSDGEIGCFTWSKDPWHTSMYRIGRVYRTKEECEKARERELAEVRLRRTSTFKPDFENGNGGWLVFYNYKTRKLDTVPDFSINSGEPVRYETIEDAKKSIIENREDWLIYFGVKERED
mgnify:CR=1 FL=1